MYENKQNLKISRRSFLKCAGKLGLTTLFYPFTFDSKQGKSGDLQLYFENMDEQEANKIIESENPSCLGKYPALGVAHLKVPEGTERSYIKEIEGEGSVLDASLNRKLHLMDEYSISSEKGYKKGEILVLFEEDVEPVDMDKVVEDMTPNMVPNSWDEQMNSGRVDVLDSFIGEFKKRYESKNGVRKAERV